MSCAALDLEDRYEKDGYRIRRCRGCGLTQLDPLPAAAIGDSLYGDHYFHGSGERGYSDYAGQEQEYLATFADDLERIADFVPAGSVLDVGCGYGYFVRQAIARGYDAYGVDVSAHAVATAAERLPGRVFCGTPASVAELAGRRFDVIFASHLIEHVSAPGDFLTDLVRRLEDGGVLVLVTPNVESCLARVSGRRWVSFKVPEHVAFYSPHTLTRLLEQAGLRPLAVDGARQFYRVPFVASRIRELIRPLDRLIPRVENASCLRGRMLRVASGSIRVIAGRRQRSSQFAVPGRVWPWQTRRVSSRHGGGTS